MPETIATYKLRGFIHDVGGELVESVPGRIRVRLGGKGCVYAAPARLAFLAGPRPPADQIDMELRLNGRRHRPRQPAADHRRLPLAAPAHVRSDLAWRQLCTQIFCDLRGYLMGQTGVVGTRRSADAPRPSFRALNTRCSVIGWAAALLLAFHPMLFSGLACVPGDLGHPASSTTSSNTAGAGRCCPPHLDSGVRRSFIRPRTRWPTPISFFPPGPFTGSVCCWPADGRMCVPAVDADGFFSELPGHVRLSCAGAAAARWAAALGAVLYPWPRLSGCGGPPPAAVPAVLHRRRRLGAGRLGGRGPPCGSASSAWRPFCRFTRVIISAGSWGWG